MWFEILLSFAVSLAGIYLYGILILWFIDFLNKKTFAKNNDSLAQENVRQRAIDLLETDPDVKKTYIELRLLHLKNKQSSRVELLEKRLRLIVREKAVRQEILHMISAKISP